MRKHWKEVFFILPAIAVAVSAVVGLWLNIPVFSPITYPGEDIVKAAEGTPVTEGETTENGNSHKKKLQQANYTGNNTWKDGTYTGAGTGFGGPIEVRVTIADGKIMDIQILTCAGETPSYLKKAKAMIPRMLAAQSPNVDTVSGATYSSNGIRVAVIQALNKAGANLSVGANTSTVQSKDKQNNTVKKKTSSVSKGQPEDGVYSGSAICEQFGYTLSLKVRFQKGKVVSLYGLKITGNEDEANEAYWKKAWKPMVKRILAAQNTDVDVVSGATYSSNAILKAYQNARAKAIKARKNQDNDNKSVKATASPSPAAKILLPDDTPQAAGTVKDGTYTVSAACEPDERKAFASYTLTADVTFTEGKCISITNFSSTDESNRSYYLKAANGTAKASGVVNQILEKQSASGISAVSGATCSSKTIRALYLQALSRATGVVQKEPADEGDESSSARTPVPLPSASPAPTVSPVAPTPTEGGSTDGSETLVKDGTYTASAMVVADEWEEFDDYNLTADVTFSGGRLTGFANLVLGDTTNQWYCNAAANGYGSKKGIVQQLIERQNGNVDAVSGATCSSMALVQIYKNALEMATK